MNEVETREIYRNDLVTYCQRNGGGTRLRLFESGNLLVICVGSNVHASDGGYIYLLSVILLRYELSHSTFL